MLLVAHRVPRTAAGCEELAAAGATMFEADVQVAVRGGAGGTDDVVFVSHYLPVRSLRGRIAQDNGRFRRGWGPPYDPTLAEVLARIPPGCGVLLDPKEKHPERRARLCAAVSGEPAVRDDLGRFAVSTDRLDDLADYRRVGLRTWRTLKSGADLARAIAAGPLPEQGVSVRHTLLVGDAVERLHRVTGTVVAWTVNDVARARTLRRLGVDGLTTDARAVLESGADDPRPRDRDR